MGYARISSKNKSINQTPSRLACWRARHNHGCRWLHDGIFSMAPRRVAGAWRGSSGEHSNVRPPPTHPRSGKLCGRTASDAPLTVYRSRAPQQVSVQNRRPQRRCQSRAVDDGLTATYCRTEPPPCDDIEQTNAVDAAARVAAAALRLERQHRLPRLRHALCRTKPAGLLLRRARRYDSKSCNKHKRCRRRRSRQPCAAVARARAVARGLSAARSCASAAATSC